MSDLVYIKQGTKIEPLVQRWYAWSHLVSPAQRAINLARRYVPILRSFVANPLIHVAASKNPQLLGGPFLELSKDAVPAVKALIDRILRDERHWLTFSDDLHALRKTLAQNETGFSLDHVYNEIPGSLSGLVELSYDLDNNPSVRVLEELVNAPAERLDVAQEVMLTSLTDDRRHFFLNTPRLEGPDSVFLSAAFNSEIFDVLSAARCSGARRHDINGIVTDNAKRIELERFLTDEPPLRKAPNYNDDGLRVRYYGHACVLLQTRNISVLIDPFVSWDGQDNDEHLTFLDLPDHIDALFITHNHQDHVSTELLLQLRGRIGKIYVPRNNPWNIADPSMKLMLHRLGFSNVVIMDALDEVDLVDGRMVSLPFFGEHADLGILSKHGIFIELLGNRFLFLADSDCKDHNIYRRIVDILGPVENLFIGMECNGAPLTWLYGPYLTQQPNRRDDESRRLSGADSASSWKIVREFDCKNIFVYAMGQESWMRFVAGIEYSPDSKQIVESDKLIEICRASGLSAERLKGCRTLRYGGAERIQNQS